VQEGLDSTQLEIYGVNCNNLKEERFKIQKRKHEDTCQQTLLPRVIKREKINFIYIDFH